MWLKSVFRLTDIAGSYRWIADTRWQLTNGSYGSEAVGHKRPLLADSSLSRGASIGHKLPFTCPQKDAQRILLKEENEKEFE